MTHEKSYRVDSDKAVELLCDALSRQELALRKQDFADLELSMQQLEIAVAACKHLVEDSSIKDAKELRSQLGQKSFDRLIDAAGTRLVVSELIALQLAQIETMLKPSLGTALDQTYGNRRSQKPKNDGPLMALSRRV